MKSPQKKEVQMLVVPPASFVAEATIYMPGDAPPQVIEFEFIHMGKKDAAAWLEALTADTEKRASEALMEIVKGSVSGKEIVPVTIELFEELMDKSPHGFADIINSWFLALGVKRLKNS
jgi:hypothetical protein